MKVVIGLLLAFALAACGKEYPSEWGDAVCDWHLEPDMRPYLAVEEHMHGGRAEIRDWRTAYEGVCSGIASYPDGASEVIVLWGSWFDHPVFLNPDGVDGPYLGDLLGLSGDRAQEVLDDYASGRWGAR